MPTNDTGTITGTADNTTTINNTVRQWTNYTRTQDQSIPEPFQPPIKYENYLEQENERIYFKGKHLQKFPYINFPDTPIPYLTFAIIFNEILSRSPFFFNYLAYKQEFIHDEIREVTYEILETPNKEEKYINLKFSLLPEYDQHILKIQINKATINLHERFLKEVRGRQYVLNTNFSEAFEYIAAPLQEKDLKINATTTQELQKFYSSNEDLSLDMFLPELDNFKELTQTVKEKIISSEYLRKPIEESSIPPEKIIENIKKTMEKRLDYQIEELNEAITSKQRTIQDYYNMRTKLIDQKTGYLESIKLFDVDKLKRVLQNKIIKKYSIADDHITIETHPIVLNLQTEKWKGITSTKHQNAIREGKSIGIGRHRIRIYLDDFKLNYTAKDNYRNHHIERHSCYGTFQNPIDDAKASRNLPKLIALAIQMLSQATIGDPAGRDTINSGYIIEKGGYILQDDGTMQTILEFLRTENHINRLGDRSYV